MNRLSLKGNRAIGVTLVLIVVGVGVFVCWKALGPKSDSTDNKQSSMQSDNSAENEATSNTEMKEAATGVIIKTGDSEYGPMLFNEQGQAIYIWEVEESSTAECYGDCAEAWPPVLTNGAPQATGSVNSALLGTTTRTDGSTQVTYNGHPLYYYAHEGVGEVECHNIRTHGGLWWVIHPSGVRAT